ncbi:MAG TPA: BatD family protein [Elusimicrobiota bacterium]|nr:BatD family protein [Elusimicrobiota bacterium]
MKKTVAVIVAGFLFSGVALSSAQDGVTFEAKVDKTSLSMDETLVLQLIIAGANLNISQPTLPPLPGFRAFSSGQSQNYSIINGVMSGQVVYHYSLAPQAPGDYTIPSFTLKAGDQVLTTEPISVHVGSSAGTVRPSPSQSPRSTVPRETRPGRKELYVTTSLNKKTAYVGEPLTLTFRFYSRAQLMSQPSYAPALTEGFLSEDLPPQRQFTEIVDGKEYTVVELKTALFPTAPGKYTISPASLECRVQDFSRSGDPFQSFFDGFFSGGQVITLRSDPIPVEVLPLPAENRPSGFQGDVGQYRISAAVDKTNVQLHEPFTLTVTVSGEGNIKAVSAPALPPLDGFKAYETLSSLNVSKDGYRVQGSKEFRTVLKPDVSGNVRIPAVPFHYFDPRAGQYRTVSSVPIVVTVKPTPIAEDTVTLPSAPALSEGVRVVGQDIRFIKTRGDLRPVRTPFTQTALFKALNFVPPLVFLLTGIWGIYRRKISADLPGHFFRKAYRNAERRRKQARRFLQKKEWAGYYEELDGALIDYLGCKLRVPSQGLTWPVVDDSLKERRFDPETIRDLQKLWEELNRVRFTPSVVSLADAERHDKELADLIRRLEKNWKN